MNSEGRVFGVLVMNQEKARFFLSHDNNLKELEKFYKKKSHLSDNREHFQSVKEGEGFVSFGKQKEKHNIKAHDLEVFGKEIAEELWRLFQERYFEKLILVLPGKVWNELLNHLHTELNDVVQENIDANLVGFSEAQILERVKSFFG